MKYLNRFWLLFFTVLCVASGVSAAEPEPWGYNLQAAASPIKERMIDLHNFLLYILTGIVLLVLGLMIYIIWRFNAKRNPVPSKRSHNVPLEIVWTLIPVLILVVIGIPSFRLLYETSHTVDAPITVKVTAHQWYWSYEYPDNGNFAFDSYMIADTDLQPNQKRLLDVDNPMVVPVNTKVRVQITSADVLHGWYVPALGVMMDAVPGKLNETWFKATSTGMFYGQCAQICGTNHAFMPIAVKVVPQEEYDAWLKTAQEKYS